MSDFASSPFTATIIALPSGEPLRIRAIRPDDEGRLTAMAGLMEPEDLRPRFFSTGHPLSPERLAQLTRLDAAREFVLIAEPVTATRFSAQHSSEPRRLIAAPSSQSSCAAIGKGEASGGC